MRGMGLHMGLSKRRRIRTNKCTNFNANPTDLTNVTKTGDAASVLSVVDDTAALTSAGLSGICTSGKVFKLDNSAGATAAVAIVAGFQGNARTHTISAYIRGGTGILQSNDGSSTLAFTADAAYRRLSVQIASASDFFLRFAVRSNAGQIVYFILNQLEEGAVATLPVIVTSGAASTVYY